MIHFTSGAKKFRSASWDGMAAVGRQLRDEASAPGPGAAAMGSGADRLVVGGRRDRCFESLSAREGMPQALDGLGQRGNLVRQPFGIGTAA